MMHFKTAKLALAGAALPLAALLAAPALADVKAGVDAWSRGDYAAAVAEWKTPAANGDADAQFNLAQAYRLGRGVPADNAKARELYRQASVKGHVKAADSYGLLLFQQGKREEAMPYILAASDRGDPRAQYVLSLAHFNADLANKDWPRAYALMTLANAAGLPQAAPALSQMDAYIPLEERQLAQSLASQLKAESDARRTAELASADLQHAGPAKSDATPRVPRPVASAPVAPSRANGPTFGVQQASSTTAGMVPSVASPPARAETPSARAAIAASGSGPWAIQLGAFGVAGNADALWSKLSRRSELSGAKKIKVPAGRVTKLLAGGFDSQSAAQDACRALKASGQDCLVTRN